MTRKAQQAQAPEPEVTDPLEAALAADPWDRTPEQQALIIKADAQVRLDSMTEDQRKLRNAPSHL